MALWVLNRKSPPIWRGFIDYWYNIFFTCSKIEKIERKLDYILSHEYIVNAEPYIMQIIEKKLNN